jgi:hypothetical protein
VPALPPRSARSPPPWLRIFERQRSTPAFAS